MINELGQKILRETYLSPTDRGYEDLFFRVACVCSIPSVVDEYLDKIEKCDDEENRAEIWCDTKFAKYRSEFESTITRRLPYTNDKNILSKMLVDTASVPVSVLECMRSVWYDYTNTYFKLMCDLEFMPATPTLINAGRSGMLSSCFFIRVGDSIEDIFSVIKDAAMILKAGGGVGFDFSLIRPEGSVISSSNGCSTGPVSYMKIVNSVGDQINQGSIRRSALMAILRADHPDILKFIECKSSEGDLANFNISVLVDDAFMHAVKSDSEITLHHPKCVNTKIKAKLIWDKLVEGAHKNGEPGILFADAIRKADPFKGKYGELGVNPCLTGDTLVSVADGRGAVSFKQLAEEGRAVPVYCVDDNGMVRVELMRNPRKTGHQKVYKVVLGNGFEVRATANHQFLVYGGWKEVKDLVGNAVECYANSDLNDCCSETAVVLEDKEEDVYNGTVDKYHNYFVADSSGRIIVSKNCGEILLLPYSSCNLAAINLSNCVNKDSTGVDFNKLVMLVNNGVEFLDNVIDLNNYPLPKNEEMTLLERRIGLGVTGLHDMLLKLGILYGSQECLVLIEKIFSLMHDVATKKSEELGRKRGVPIALFEAGVHRRNSGLLAAQPTGSISMIMNQVSSGIEPVFKWSYTRKDSHGEHEIRHFMLDRFNGILPEHAKTATEIPMVGHVRVLAALNKYIDNNISKTVNAANETTVGEIDEILKMAHTSKCKSITVYRTGSREHEVLVSKDGAVKTEDVAQQVSVSRPRILFGATWVVNTPIGKMFLTINESRASKTREVLLHAHKPGSETAALLEAIGRLISIALKSGVPPESMIEHLIDIKSSPVWDGGRLIKSVPDAIAKTMREYKEYFEGFSTYLEDTVAAEIDSHPVTDKKVSGELCPSCGEPLYMAAGCSECGSCGYSKCG